MSFCVSFRSESHYDKNRTNLLLLTRRFSTASTLDAFAVSISKYCRFHQVSAATNDQSTGNNSDSEFVTTGKHILFFGLRLLRLESECVV